MLRMILADDEPIIIRGIKKLVDWEKLGVSIIGEYYDGNDAMEQILLKKPDIALLDISMPGMTGMEILQNIHEMELGTKVIFISGFQEFQYAKNAITYGAVEYLLKPVIKDELIAAVEKAVEYIWEEKPENILQDLQKTVPQQEKKTIKEVSLEESTYLLVLAEILLDGNESIQEEKLIRFSFFSFLEEYIMEKGLGIVFIKNQHIILILKKIQRSHAKRILIELWQESCEMIGKKTAFVMAQVVENMKDIPKQYEQCLEMSRYFFFESQIAVPVIMVGTSVFNRQVEENDISVIRTQIIDAIFSQNIDTFHTVYERFVRDICISAEGRKDDACYNFCYLIRLAEERLHKMNQELMLADMKSILEEGRQCKNYSQMIELFKLRLDRYVVFVKKLLENNEKKDIFLAKEYIEKHYKENLTLDILAKEIHMNPFYFSSYFKKNAGENFKDYVNKVRIEHAVSLLISTDMRLYEIAAEVGFRDVRSFTEGFTKVYGETPGNYRKRMIGENR